MSWHALVLYSFLRLKNNLLYGYATFCLSFYLLMDMWVVSASCAAVNMGVHVREYLFQFLWVYMGVESLCHMVFPPASSVTTAGPP